MMLTGFFVVAAPAPALDTYDEIKAREVLIRIETKTDSHFTKVAISAISFFSFFVSGLPS